MLKIYGVARSVVRRMAPVCAAIERHDGDLARQLRRALTSVLLNMREGSHSQGRNRNARYWNAAGSLNEVLGVLEQQLVVVSLLRDVLDRGLQVAIGSETGLENLAECALVLSPYEVEGEPVGTVAVLGPTRMDYVQALAAVAVVSNRLGRRLSEG